MQTTPDTATPVTKLVAGRFDGMLGRIQTSAFGDFVRHGMDRQVAHKVCMDLGSDIGNAMRHAPKKATDDLNAQVSKANKESARSFKISGKTAAITESRSMSLKVIVQHLDTLHDEGLTDSRVTFGDLDLNESLNAYVSDCEAWAGKQEWKTTDEAKKA